MNLSTVLPYFLILGTISFIVLVVAYLLSKIRPALTAAREKVYNRVIFWSGFGVFVFWVTPLIDFIFYIAGAYVNGS